MTISCASLRIKNPLIYHGLDSKLQQSMLDVIKLTLITTGIMFAQAWAFSRIFKDDALQFGATPDALLKAAITNIAVSLLIPYSYKALSKQDQKRLIEDCIKTSNLKRLRLLIDSSDLSSFSYYDCAKLAMNEGHLEAFKIVASHSRIDFFEKKSLCRHAVFADLEFLKALFQIGLHPEIILETFSVAAFYGEQKVIHYMLEADFVDQEIIDFGFKKACQGNQIGIIDTLLSSRSVSNEGFLTAIMDAARLNRLNILDRCAASVMLSGPRGSLLKAAAQAGYTTLCARLLRSVVLIEDVKEAFSFASDHSHLETLDLFCRSSLISRDDVHQLMMSSAAHGRHDVYHFLNRYYRFSEEEVSAHLIAASSSLSSKLIFSILKSSRISEESRLQAADRFTSSMRLFHPPSEELDSFCQTVFRSKHAFDVLRANGAFIKYFWGEDRDKYAFIRHAIMRPDGSSQLELMRYASPRLITHYNTFQDICWQEEHAADLATQKKLETMRRAFSIVLRSGF